MINRKPHARVREHLRRATSVAILVLGLAGCGRRGFDARSDGGDAMISGADARQPCASGDGVCELMCIDIDRDCATTCGDGTCVGNAGEKCGSCPADCRTLSPVCGNGACDGLETSLSCPTDCGPAPWPNAVEEANFIAMINATRAGGGACSGMAPPLTVYVDPQDTARHLAWHIAHQPWLPGTVLCNGTTILSIQSANGFAQTVLTNAGPGAVQAFTAFAGAANGCQEMMSTTYTMISAGGITDPGTGTGWVALFR